MNTAAALFYTRVLVQKAEKSAKGSKGCRHLPWVIAHAFSSRPAAAGSSRGLKGSCHTLHVYWEVVREERGEA